MTKILTLLLTITIFFSCVTGPGGRSPRYLFGHGMSLGEELYVYDSSRSLQGDGYSVVFYKASDEFTDYVISNLGIIKEEYPDKPYFREEWDLYKWQNTPITVNKEELISFATSSGDKSENGLKSKRYIKMLLEEEGNIYAYLSKSSFSDLDLFIFSPSRGILVMVNHNT